MKSELEQAFSAGIRYLVSNQAYARAEREHAVPGDARKTDLNVGDHFFLEGEVEDGMALEGVIVQKSKDGYARYVLLDSSTVWWVKFEPLLSCTEALRKTAESEMDYYSKRAEYAEECLKAIEAGEDISAFLKVKDFDS